MDNQQVPQDIKPKWHPTSTQRNIAIFGVIAILGLASVYAQVSYVAFKNYNEVAAQAKKTQEDILALQQKRQSNPPSTSDQFNVPYDWKTYTNTEYGFEFRYPGDWAVDFYNANKDRPDALVTVSAPSGSQGSHYSLIIFLINNPNKYNANEYADKIEKAKYSEEGSDMLGYKDAFSNKVGEYDAYELSGVGTIDNTEMEQIFVTRDNLAIEFWFPQSKQASPVNVLSSEANNLITHQILSTFKFTK